MRIIVSVVIILLSASSSRAQDAGEPDPRPSNRWSRFGHEFLLPFGSVFVPGLGQWANGAVAEGFGFFGASLAGSFIVVANEDGGLSTDELPRDKEDQLTEIGLQLSLSAGLLSGYDSFRRSLPKLRAGGRYDFLESTTPTAQTLVAPFKLGYLRNKRTWIFLTVPMAFVAAAAIEDEGNNLPFKWNDAVYAAGVSFGAGVSEEAFFRGYLFPWFNELYGERMWFANSSQAVLFGLVHLPTVEVPVVQTLAGLYWGWVAHKNDWDIQETIFQHFWWDVIVFTGALLLDDGGNSRVSISLPPIRF